MENQRLCVSHIQHDAVGALDAIAHADQEGHRLAPIHQPVVVGEREILETRPGGASPTVTATASAAESAC